MIKSFNDIAIGLVGPGLIGLRHLDILLEAKQIAVSGIVSPNRNNKVVKSSKIPQFRSVKALIDTTRLDGVIIASPTQVHFEHASELIKASIPILVEKPVGQSANEIIELIHLSETYDTPVCVGHHRVYGALFDKLRHILQTEQFGACHHFVAKTIFKKPSEYWVERDWRALPENGGVIGINLIHDIDISQRLFGPIHHVYCDLIEHSSYPNLVSRGQALVRFENGTQGAFIFSDGSAASASWELTTGENPGFQKHRDACYEFYFEDGYLMFPEFRLAQGEKLNWLSEFKTEVFDAVPDDPLENQISHFKKVIEGREAPKVTLRDALQNRYVMDALFRSAATKQWVDVSAATDLML